MKDIVVTGMGVLSTAGNGLEEFWNTLYQGKVTYGPIPEFENQPDYRIKIGARIANHGWKENLPERVKEQYGSAACYCAGTVQKALDDAGIELSQAEPARISVIIGTTMGEVQVEEEIAGLKCRGKKVQEGTYRKYPTFNIVKAVADITGARGQLLAIPAACAAGNYAVALGKNLLNWNYADIVIAGGVDVFSQIAYAGFQRLLSLDPDLCRPFDKDRKGLVLGEGCGILIMEREKERRNQKVYGRILGCGLATSAWHMTAPHHEGWGEYISMERAVEDAGIRAADIDYVSAHGTGTRLNDAAEAKAIDRIFKGRDVPISSIKSMLGHSLGAASALELIASFLMICKKGYLPNVNYSQGDEESRLHILVKPTEGEPSYILSNSFAFGGQTSCVAIGR